MSATGAIVKRFPLGHIFVTAGALMVDPGGDEFRGLLDRHAAGDWGELSASDKEANDRALFNSDDRILSAYTTRKGVRVWIVTEEDGGATPEIMTTILLPEEN